MKIVFVKEYRDENSETSIPVPPIEIGQEGMLLDEVNGIVELSGGDLDGLRLEYVPTSYYGEAKDDE